MSSRSERPMLASVGDRPSEVLSPMTTDSLSQVVSQRSAHHWHGQSFSTAQEDLRNAFRRRGTVYETAPVDARQPEQYFFRRPLARFVHFEGKVYKASEDGSMSPAHLRHEHSSGKHHAHSAEHDDPIQVRRERLDLFMDLVWVGIISNISENFFSGAFESPWQISVIFSEFILLFLPTWSYWVRIQQWLNLYFMDDGAQRLFIIWLLILALIWGNNTSYFLTPNAHQPWTIDTYVIGVGSMKALELVYTIWIPWMRRQTFVELVGWLPALILWILAGTLDNLDNRYNFIVAATVYDYVWTTAMSSPIGDFLVGSNFRKAQDHKHLTSRYGNFFIIAIGEGVFLLIRSSPLGEGLTLSTGIGVQAIIVYFIISTTYFRSDNSKRYIHAQNRSWLVQTLWTMFHLPLLCALVLLSSGVLYIVDYTAGYDEAASAPEQGGGSEPAARAILRARSTEGAVQIDHETFRAATTTVFVALAVIYASMLALALLNRSQDRGSELVVGNRYLRLLPRFIAVAIFATIWLYDFTDPVVVLAWAVLVVMVVFLLETLGGMERWPKLFEPKNSYPRLASQAQVLSELELQEREKPLPMGPVEPVQVPKTGTDGQEQEINPLRGSTAGHATW